MIYPTFFFFFFRKVLFTFTMILTLFFFYSSERFWYLSRAFSRLFFLFLLEKNFATFYVFLLEAFPCDLRIFIYYFYNLKKNYIYIYIYIYIYPVYIQFISFYILKKWALKILWSHLNLFYFLLPKFCKSFLWIYKNGKSEL